MLGYVKDVHGTEVNCIDVYKEIFETILGLQVQSLQTRQAQEVSALSIFIYDSLCNVYKNLSSRVS